MAGANTALERDPYLKQALTKLVFRATGLRVVEPHCAHLKQAMGHARAMKSDPQFKH